MVRIPRWRKQRMEERSFKKKKKGKKAAILPEFMKSMSLWSQEANESYTNKKRLQNSRIRKYS